MNQQSNYIVFLCYGNEAVFMECAFALLSLTNLYETKELKQFEIWIYTDNPTFFSAFKDCNLLLYYRTIDNTILKQWRGNIDFAHRIKIEALLDFTKNKQGNVLYIDTDVVFTNRIDPIFTQIEAGKLYMHVCEGIVNEGGNPIMQKLNQYFKQQKAVGANGKPLHQLAMWNAGVLGFNTAQKDLLNKVLAFTDHEYPKFPKHIVEQFAFSVYFQQVTDVKAAAPYITHYWNLKEARLVLASFFN